MTQNIYNNADARVGAQIKQIRLVPQSSVRLFCQLDPHTNPPPPPPPLEHATLGHAKHVSTVSPCSPLQAHTRHEYRAVRCDVSIDYKQISMATRGARVPKCARMQARHCVDYAMHAML